MTTKPHLYPLSGRRILVGRARHQASKLSAALRKLGAEVIEIPFIEIRPPKSYKPFDTALKNVTIYDWLILTSVNGADALAGRIDKLGITSAALRKLKIAAIGPATKKRVEDMGLKVALVPKRYIAESVVESLCETVGGKRVLLVRAKVARDVIPRELRKAGADVEVIEAYETVVPVASRKRLRLVMSDPNLMPNIVCFTSSSTVRNFVHLMGGSECPSDTKFASIGPVTSSTLRELGLPVHIEAKEYTIPGLIRAIAEDRRNSKE